jgi:hypothetical protein
MGEHGGMVLKPTLHVGKKGTPLRGMGRVSRGGPAVDRLMAVGAIPPGGYYERMFRSGMEVWMDRHPTMQVPTDVRASRIVDQKCEDELPKAPGGDPSLLNKFLDHYADSWAAVRREQLKKRIALLQAQLKDLSPTVKGTTDDDGAGDVTPSAFVPKVVPEVSPVANTPEAAMQSVGGSGKIIGPSDIDIEDAPPSLLGLK